MKKRFWRRAAAACLSLLLVTGNVPIEPVTDLFGVMTVSAASEWKFDSEKGELTISGEGEMGNFGDDNQPWRSHKDDITSVTIESGITTVGTNAFNGFSNINSITIPDGITEIGLDAFKGCTGLTSVYCEANPANLTWNTDGHDFIYDEEDPEHRTTCYVPEEYYGQYYREFSDNVNVTFMPMTRSGKCGDEAKWILKTPTGELTISGEGDMYNYEWDDQPWYKFMNDITSVVVEDGITSVGSMAFRDCLALTSVTFSDSVEKVGHGAFYRCGHIASVKLSDNIESIDYDAFFENASLTSITLPYGLESIGNCAFCGCTSLTAITIPSSVTSIGIDALARCTNLKTIIYGGSASQWAELTEYVYFELPEGCTMIFVKEAEPVKAISIATAFKGKFEMNFYLYLPEFLTSDEGAYAMFTGGSADKKIMLNGLQGTETEEGVKYKLSYDVYAKEVRDVINLRLYYGNGEKAAIVSATGMKDYTETGIETSLLTYLDYCSTSSDEKLAALAEAAKNYCTAVQINFGYKAEGLSFAEELDDVTEEMLKDYAAKITGTMPAGVSVDSISAIFEADNSFRLYLKYDGSVAPRKYKYYVNDKAVKLKSAGGKYYLEVKNVGSNHLDDDVKFTVTRGKKSCDVTVSVLTYARSCVLYGSGNLPKLAKALYLYNQAAVAKFGK